MNKTEIIKKLAEAHKLSKKKAKAEELLAEIRRKSNA